MFGPTNIAEAHSQRIFVLGERHHESMYYEDVLGQESILQSGLTKAIEMRNVGNEQ